MLCYVIFEFITGDLVVALNFEFEILITELAVGASIVDEVKVNVKVMKVIKKEVRTIVV